MPSLFPRHSNTVYMFTMYASLPTQMRRVRRPIKEDHPAAGHHLAGHIGHVCEEMR